MKKSVLIILFLVIVSSLLSAGDTYHIETEHFDIVYPSSSSKMAFILYENCESIYDQVTDFLNFEGNLNLTVCITDDINTLNAFYTNWPYEKIVMYDTLSRIDSLSVYNDSFLGIFRHELTHAIQANTKLSIEVSGKKIPLFSLQNIYSTKYVTEGLAVLSESAEGFGRLNDEATMHVLTQAKLEDNLLSELQVRGGRDTYPLDVSYIYGSAFLQWLSQKYGHESVVAFINEMTKLIPVTTYGKFKKTFGIPLKEAWKSFADSIPLYEASEEKDLGLEKGYYSSLKLLDGKIYVYDDATDALNILENRTLKKVFSGSSSYMEFNMMSDGTLLIPLISDNTERLNVIKNGRIIHTFDNGRAAFPLSLNGNECYGVLERNGQETSIAVYSQSFELLKKIKLGYGVRAQDFCKLENGSTAFLINKGSVTQIALLTSDGQNIMVLDNPDNIEFRSLTSSGNTLCFSYSNGLFCYGKITVNNDNAIVQCSDTVINGGIFCPVLIDSEITYIAEMAEYSKICYEDESSLHFEEPYSVCFSKFVPSDVIPNSEFSEKSEKYNFFNNIKHFGILPLASGSSHMFDTYIGPGIAFLTEEPSEHWTLSLSAGYDPFVKDFFLSGNTGFKFKNGWNLEVDINSTLKKFAPDISFDLNKNYTLRHVNEKILLDLKAGCRKTDIFKAGSALTITYYNFTRKSMRNNGFYGPQGTIQLSATYENKTINSDAFVQFLYVIPSAFAGVEASYSKLDGLAVSGGINVTPVNWEIQNGILDIYFNRFKCDLTYTGTYFIKEETLKQEISAKAVVTLSPGFGSLSSSHFDIGVNVTHVIGEDTDVKAVFDFGL